MKLFKENVLLGLYSPLNLPCLKIILIVYRNNGTPVLKQFIGRSGTSVICLRPEFNIFLLYLSNLMLGSVFLKNVEFKITEAEVIQ